MFEVGAPKKKSGKNSNNVNNNNIFAFHDLSAALQVKKKCVSYLRKYRSRIF